LLAPALLDEAPLAAPLLFLPVFDRAAGFVLGVAPEPFAGVAVLAELCPATGVAAIHTASAPTSQHPGHREVLEEKTAFMLSL
jgi:hypothetical protein